MAAGSEIMAQLRDPAGALLGEGPVWHVAEQAVYWVDIKGRRLNRYKPEDGAVQRWSFHDNLAWVLPRRAGGWVAGTRHEIGELSLDPELVFTPRLRVEPDKPGNRLNDAKIDADGTIWFGTMDDNEAAPSGAFYRILPDFSVLRIDTGFTIANGPAFAPDGRTIYHTDSAARTIYRYPRHHDGTVGPRMPFIRFTDADGFPDGMTVDAKGGLWVAHWGGGRVSRFTPEGVLDRTLALPVSQVTSCCFGGANLDRLFVTTAAIGLSAERQKGEPLAGGLFELAPNIEGLPAPLFAG
jgi:sugar lactone lactonase YvrE